MVDGFIIFLHCAGDLGRAWFSGGAMTSYTMSYQNGANTQCRSEHGFEVAGWCYKHALASVRVVVAW